MMSDYQSGNVSVDRAFARFGSKSFAINKITSVDVRSSEKPGAKGFYFFWGVAILFALSGIAQVVQLQNGVLPLLMALFCGFFGYLSYLKRRAVITYRLFLHTAGSEAQAYETKNEREITSLRTALESAMAQSS